MNIDKLIKKEVKKKENKSKINFGYSIFGVTKDMEFRKWLNYESNEEKEKKELFSINFENLTLNQIEELKIYNEEKIYSNLFNKYEFNTKECNYEDYLMIYNYMNTHSIEALMAKKLTQKEIEIANNKVMELFLQLNKDQINEYLLSFNTLNNPDEYYNMNIIDAYIFHRLGNIYLENKIIPVNDLINSNSKILVLQ